MPDAHRPARPALSRPQRPSREVLDILPGRMPPRQHVPWLSESVQPIHAKTLGKTKRRLLQGSRWGCLNACVFLVAKHASEFLWCPFATSPFQSPNIHVLQNPGSRNVGLPLSGGDSTLESKNVLGSNPEFSRSLLQCVRRYTRFASQDARPAEPRPESQRPPPLKIMRNEVEYQY